MKIYAASYESRENKNGLAPYDVDVEGMAHMSMKQIYDYLTALLKSRSSMPCSFCDVQLDTPGERFASIRIEDFIGFSDDDMTKHVDVRFFMKRVYQDHRSPRIPEEDTIKSVLCVSMTIGAKTEVIADLETDGYVF